MKTLVAVLALAAGPAFALPSGQSGLNFGGGAIVGGDTYGFIQGEFDFGLPPYVTLGPEIGVGFGDGTLLTPGLECRIYLIPTREIIPQPYIAFSGGFAAFWFESHFWGFPISDFFYGGYMNFDGGLDVDVPKTLISPYVEAGGMVFIAGGGADGAFRIEGGLRFDVW